jgi:hypothetical protein
MTAREVAAEVAAADRPDNGGGGATTNGTGFFYDSLCICGLLPVLFLGIIIA